MGLKVKDTWIYISSNRRLRRALAIIIMSFSLQLPMQSAKAQEDDIFQYLPAILAATIEARSCDDGVFANCTSSLGCRHIDGVFEGGICMAKPEAHALAEQLSGQWKGLTSLDSGSFYNNLQFSLSSLASLNGNSAYSLSGESHKSANFDSTVPNPVVASYDSGQDDWYILDFWGTDIGEISILEVAQTRANQFDGCEFFLNYPDLSYKDGNCHRVRLQRSGKKPSFAAQISNIIADISNYIVDVVSSAQGTSLDARVAEKRPSIDRIRGLLALKTTEHNPLVILSPNDQSTTNSNIVQVLGTVEVNLNLDRVELQGQRVFPDSNNFQGNVVIDEGASIISASANYGRRTYTVEVTIETDDVQPTVVAATSSSSTSVVLQFSEPMSDDSVAAIGNFNIVRNDNNGTLPITAVQFVDASHTSVLVATGLQSDVIYTITAVNVKDRAGNTISSPIPEVLVDLSKAEFVGTAPTGNEVVDTDGDGILDHIELDGWPVTIIRTDGTTETIIVTSDPFNADTDGDGISDAEERHGGMNPRNNDSDGDTLPDYDEWNIIYSNPVDQDSDDDGIQDGFEYLFFKTSPILADTDGDQIDDPTELASGNRNALIADLPSPSISIGNVNMELDTRFTFTDLQGEVVSEGKSVETTLTQAEDESFSKANETSTKNTLNESLELTQKLEVQKNFGISDGVASASVNFSFESTQKTEQGSERGNTSSFGEESSRSSEEAYHDSLSTSTERNIEQSITRELVDAFMKVDLSIDNDGDIPFTITNLELTAQAQDPNDRRKMVPIATLVPENSSLGSVNIGALGDPSRGPFVFKTESVFPQQIEQLMKNPRGLIVQLANYDIVDQEGNNFAFTSQDVLDKTAGITFDLGDGRTESFRIATASEHNENTGEPNGISMARALEIAGLTQFKTIRDGGNGRVDTPSDPSDEAVALPGSFVEPGTVIIRVGENEVLDTTLVAGDDVIVDADYAIEPFVDIPFIRDGGNGVVETTVSGDDNQIAAPGSTVEIGSVVASAVGELDTSPGGDDIVVTPDTFTKVLARFRDVETNIERTQFWVLFTQERTQGIDLTNLRIRAGEQYDFTFVQDKDGDQVWAREEYLHGSSDLLANSDDDELSDFEEIKEGWVVQLNSSPQGYRVFPNPNQADSDRDRLLDEEEKACQLDPRQRDTDLDGLTDWEELNGKLLVDGLAIDMRSRDPNSNEVTHEVRPYAGVNTVNGSFSEELGVFVVDTGLVPHNSIATCDDLLSTRYNGLVGFATNPLDADTDGDLIDDLTELKLGINPNDPTDGPLFLDDDGDGIPNLVETDIGYEISVSKLNDDGSITTETRTVITNPNEVDSDNDGLPDLLEKFIGSDAQSLDTDNDGISDRNEYKIGGEVCVSAAVNVPCIKFKDKVQMSFDQFERECANADACNPDAIETELAGPDKTGTSLNRADSDFDGRTDFAEVTPFGLNVNDSIIPVTSNPLLADTDGDMLSDGDELNGLLKSNPNLGNTDGDSKTDLEERALTGRDPAFTDKSVRIIRKSIRSVTTFPLGTLTVNHAYYTDPQNATFVTSCNYSQTNFVGLGDANDAAVNQNFECDIFDGVLRQGAADLVIQSNVRYIENNSTTFRDYSACNQGDNPDQLTNFSYDLNTSGADVVAPRCGQSDFAETLIYGVEVQ